MKALRFIAAAIGEILAIACMFVIYTAFMLINPQSSLSRIIDERATITHDLAIIFNGDE